MRHTDKIFQFGALLKNSAPEFDPEIQIVGLTKIECKKHGCRHTQARM
jgi:hypothetical protein